MPTGAYPRVEGRPLVLGHRGASAEAPENTVAAFQLAMATGADGFELDVWRCASGEPVVIHDASAARTAGEPLDVRREPLAALRRLDAGSWKAPRFAGERIPTLAEVLEAFPRAVVNVELKSDGLGDPRLAAAVARLLRDRADAERVVVSSFDYLLLAALRLAAPRLASGLLFAADQHWRVRARLGALLRPSAVHPERTLCEAGRIEGWKADGLRVCAWTVDDPREVGRLARAGVDGLIANDPGRAREAVRAATGR